MAGSSGRNDGLVTSGGDIIAKFCNEADLVCQGDIKVAAQLMNCHVRTEGKLVSEHAAVIGGQLYAKYGGDVGVLGS